MSIRENLPECVDVLVLGALVLILGLVINYNDLWPGMRAFSGLLALLIVTVEFVARWIEDCFRTSHPRSVRSIATGANRSGAVMR